MIMNDFFSKILHLTNLESELDDYDKIHETIEKDLIFKGTNLWILAFAIIVASVGLNMNSTAVIIGAMLISPLMGPINGMGYSIATYNLPLFKKSLKNFSFAVIASLLASTGYFLISPISTAHSELLARTSPTIYDVLIALFGGLAGIVAISSKQKGNVIPGVAIATALMPPLCTAGYGLATMQITYFSGAFYLFTINAVFIAISSVIISQILKFPIRTLVDPVQKKRVDRWISVVIMLVLIPSIYFGYNLVQKEKFNENATKYINSIRLFENNYLLDKEINADKKSINLIYGGVQLTDDQKGRIREKALLFSLEEAQIMFSPGLSFGMNSEQVNEKQQLINQINQLTTLVNQKNEQIDSLLNSTEVGKQLLDEISVLFPGITGCSYFESTLFNTSENKAGPITVIVFTTKNQKISLNERNKIEKWLSAKLKDDNIRIYYEKE
jgi:uncharacterized hydrophobic protein (TIGR00271 family)